MNERFKDMVKVPKEPVAKMLSVTNTRLKTPIDAPVAARPKTCGRAGRQGCDARRAAIDAACSRQETCVVVACLAARDIFGPKSDKDPKCLATSEAWVFDPSEDNRKRARVSMDDAYIDDPTVNIAMSVLYSDGTLGPADLSEYPAPAGAAETYSFVMNVVALDKNSDRFEEYGQMLIDRAVNIARGGNGKLEAREPMKEATQ